MEKYRKEIFWKIFYTIMLKLDNNKMSPRSIFGECLLFLNYCTRSELVFESKLEGLNQNWKCIKCIKSTMKNPCGETSRKIFYLSNT